MEAEADTKVSSFYGKDKKNPQNSYVTRVHRELLKMHEPETFLHLPECARGSGLRNTLSDRT